jgi:DNA-binding CsgD family transcriptional regulator
MADILGLIDRIYESVADGSRWQVFLADFAQAVHARGVSLALQGLKRHSLAFSCFHGWRDAEIRLYTEKYAAEDPWQIGTLLLPENTVGADEILCPRKEMEASKAFREFYAPLDYVHGMGGIILVTPMGQSAIAALRGSSLGPFNESELAILRALMPHLRRAALLRGDIDSMRARCAALSNHLDRYPHPLLLADSECRVLHANAAAIELGQLHDGLRLDAGRLSFGRPQTDRRFCEAVYAVACGRDSSLQRMEVARPSGKPPLRVLLMPAPEQQTFGFSSPAVTVLVIDAGIGWNPDVYVLSELFSLTPSEARVAARLLLGEDLKEAAAALGVGMETVRTHVKRVMAKTSTRRQGELISMLLRAVPFRRL